MSTVYTIVGLAALFGAFGGIASGLARPTSYRLRLPSRSPAHLELGILGDGLIGATASMAILFFIKPLVNLAIKDDHPVIDYISLVSLSVSAGFAGIRILASTSTKVYESLSTLTKRVEQVERSDKAHEYVNLADDLLDKDPHQADIVYDAALRIDPNHENAWIGKAKVCRRLEQFDRAIDILSMVLTRNPQAERAAYNRSCYKNVSKAYSKEEVLSDLQLAIELFDDNRAFALNDTDFADLCGDPDFQKLVKPAKRSPRRSGKV